AGVAVNGSAVPLDDRTHLAEIAGKEILQGLRIEGLAEPGRVDDIGKQERCRFADLLSRLSLRCRPSHPHRLRFADTAVALPMECPVCTRCVCRRRLQPP